MDRPAAWSSEHAASFEDVGVARAYRHRPPYAAAAILRLSELCDPGCRVVLDLGSGTGNVALRIAPLVERVDAVEPSRPMVAAGREEPSAHADRVHWILGFAEAAALRPPYGLATAGDSLHWMDWDKVLPRLATALTPRGRLAVIEVTGDAWGAQPEVIELIKRYSVYGDTYRAHDVIDEITARGLFRAQGIETFREHFTQSLDSFITSFHARASLSVTRIGVERTQAFDRELASVIDAHPELLARDVTTRVVWGVPTIR